MYKELTCGTYERQPNFLLQSLSVVDNLGSRRLLCIQDPRYDIPSMHRVTHTGGYCSCTTPREKRVCERPRDIKNLQLHHWYLLAQQRRARCLPMDRLHGASMAESLQRRLRVYASDVGLFIKVQSMTAHKNTFKVMRTFRNSHVCSFMLLLEWICWVTFEVKWCRKVVRTHTQTQHVRKLTILHSAFFCSCVAVPCLKRSLNLSTFYCCIMCCCIWTFFGGKS